MVYQDSVALKLKWEIGSLYSKNEFYFRGYILWENVKLLRFCSPLGSAILGIKSL